MALPLAALAVLALAGVILLELSRAGTVEGVLVRYGYQLAIVAGGDPGGGPGRADREYRR